MNDGSYRQGFRAGVGAVVRGLLRIDTDEIDAGALVGSLSAYEALLDAWVEDREVGAPEPVWQPAPEELRVEHG